MMNINANVNVNTNPNTKQVNYIQNSPSNNSKYVNYSNLGFRDGSGGFNSGYVRASNGNMDAHVNQLSRTLTNTNSNSKLITSQSINPRNRSANKLT
jgi:hypothetical protein